MSPKVFSEESLRKIAETIAYPEESFNKFTDPQDPQYADYKDRNEELWLDKGFNLGVEYFLNALLKKLQ